MSVSAAIVEAVRTLDDRKLTREQIETVLSVMPTSEEIALVRDMNRPDVPLAQQEEFFLKTAALPNMQLRLKAWLFRYTFDETIKALELKLGLIRSACGEVRDSKILPKLFGLVLAVGNYLNAGNTRTGQADGFELPCLLKIADQRGKDVSLLEFVIHEYARDTNAVPIAKLPDELSCATRCAGLELVEIQAEVSRLDSLVRSTRSNVERVVADASVQNHHSDPFRHAMPEFMGKAAERVESLKSLMNKVNTDFKTTVDYFGGKPKTSTEFFEIFQHFCKQVHDAMPKTQPVKHNALTDPRTRGKIGERVGGSEEAMGQMIQQLKAGLGRNKEGVSPRA